MGQLRDGDTVAYRIDPAMERIWKQFRRALRECTDRELEAIVLRRLEARGGTGTMIVGTLENDGSVTVHYRIGVELALLDVRDFARQATANVAERRSKVHTALTLAGF